MYVLPLWVSSVMLVKLTRASLHPGMAVLLDCASGLPVAQIGSPQVDDLLGARESAFYMAEERDGAFYLVREVPREQLGPQPPGEH